jgi:hypothetical protein
MSGTIRDLTGQRFGILTVKHRGENYYRKNGEFRGVGWVCACDCGVDKTFESYNLVSGNTKSCGCKKHKWGTSGRKRVLTDTQRKHNNRMHYWRSPEKYIWKAMKSRCLDPRNKGYYRYGGRGITVHKDFLGDFGLERFIAEIGKRPTPHHTVDRIDNSRGYEPGNIRWATRVQQARNTSRNCVLTMNGRSQTLTEWAAETGIRRETISMRIKKMGWDIERALTTPADERFGSRRSQ